MVDGGDGGRGSSTAQLLARLEGVTVALVTPLDSGGRLDTSGLERLIEHVIASGACCLFPLGWAGEAPRLPDSVRREMVVQTCRINGGRLPVMAGVSEQSLPRALELAAVAREGGADMIISTPPYSYPVRQEIVYDYFKGLATESGMPVVAYQNDEVNVGIEGDTLEELSRTPGMIGVKSFLPFSKLQTAFHGAHNPGRFAVMSGDERLFGAALFAGIRHFTMGTPGNICLRWCVGIYQSALQGDWEAVGNKQRRLTELCDALYPNVEAPSATAKYLMQRAGMFASCHVTPPNRELPAEQRELANGIVDEFSDVFDVFDVFER